MTGFAIQKITLWCIIPFLVQRADIFLSTTEFNLGKICTQIP